MTSTRILPKRPMCVNRTETLEELTRPARHEGVPVQVAITGAEGIGKTTLAAELVHRINQRYDICLLYWVHASVPQRAVTAGQIAGFFVGRLGTSDTDIPADELERFLVLGELLGDRRALIMLDDVQDAAQISPLLDYISADVILTSRNRMPSLARSGFQTVELDLFDEHSSGLLVRRIVDESRGMNDELVRKLHSRAGGLPLALSVLAARLDHPDCTTADEEWLLLDPPEQDGDGERAVRSMFDALDVDRARECATLALIPGTHFDTATAAAALGLPEDRTRRVLRALRDAHLLLPPDDGQYGFHTMLRRFAVDRALALLSDSDRAEIVRRVIEHRWRRVVALDRSISGRPAPKPAAAWYAAAEPAFTGAEAVRNGFDELHREWQNMLATADEARKLPRFEIGELFSLGLWFFAFKTAKNEEIVEVHDAILAVAEDPVLRRQLLVDKAASCASLGQGALADECIGQAASLSDRAEMQSLYDWSGNMLESRGDYEGALGQFERSRAAIKDMDSQTHQERASALLDTHVGRVLARLDRADEARPLLSRACDYFAMHDTDRANHAHAKAWLGTITPSWHAAQPLLSEALSTFLELGMIEQARQTCEWLARAAESANRPDDADRYRQRARQLGEQRPHQ